MLAAARWYDEQLPGLGDTFLDCVTEIVLSLPQQPLIYALRFSDVRRAPVPRFTSYGVFYAVRNEEIIIFAILHGKRHPRWLRQRRKRLD
jgi:plasmid stabilization system protein ParE